MGRSGAPLELSTDQEAVRALARALDAEADGKKLRRELAKDMRGALEPAKPQIIAGLMSIGHSGMPTDGEPLRGAVAKNIKIEARLSGKATGARIRVKKTKGLRDFALAPKRLNSAKGWRRRVFGSNHWVVQFGKVGYFDDPIESRKGEYRDAVFAAMEKMAARIAARAKRG